MGLAGDEQADLSVHGGLDKAVYAYPQEHYAFWQAQRREQGVSLFDEGLPPGFVGENLSISGLLEPTCSWATSCTLPTACCASPRRASPASSSTP
jgi:MOSC domain-containing protein YiiM